MRWAGWTLALFLAVTVGVLVGRAGATTQVEIVRCPPPGFPCLGQFYNGILTGNLDDPGVAGYALFVPGQQTARVEVEQPGKLTGPTISNAPLLQVVFPTGSRMYDISATAQLPMLGDRQNQRYVNMKIRLNRPAPVRLYVVWENFGIIGD
jgi:hypothetical protein